MRGYAPRHEATLVTRVYVVAESAVERAGLESLVAQDGDVTVVGQGSRGVGAEQLAAQIDRVDPDVILVALAPDDAAAHPGPDVLLGLVADGTAAMLVMGDVDAEWVASAMREGLHGVIPRDATAAVIGAAVRAVATGLSVLPRQLVAAAVPTSAARQPRTDDDQTLTARETEVLGMLAEGLGNKQIAARLGISEHTVKFHLASIFTKLHAGTRTEAVMLGARRGLVVV